MCTPLREVPRLGHQRRKIGKERKEGGKETALQISQGNAENKRKNGEMWEETEEFHIMSSVFPTCTV